VSAVARWMAVINVSSPGILGLSEYSFNPAEADPG
jgi:hypothetical protein